MSSLPTQIACEPSSVSSAHLYPRRTQADPLSVTDYDKILVLGAGEVLEFDSPANLLEKEGSVFAELCQKSGEYDELKEIAMAKRAEGKRA